VKNKLLLVLLTVALAACANKQVKDEPKPAVAEPSAAQEAKPAQAPVAASTEPVKQSTVQSDPLHDPNNILFKRSVYFDFDKYEVKPEYRALVEAHAQYLMAHPQRNITLEGNADERGSREYNLALGQKRAVAVKKVMNVYGVQDKQIETVSYGKEKPKAQGHDETSWAENRRVDVKYAGE
jgi:peptidoglycan-associated lipoprotein